MGVGIGARRGGGGSGGRVKDELEHPDLQSRALCSKERRHALCQAWDWGVEGWGWCWGSGVGGRWRFVVRYSRNIAPPPPRGRGYVEAEEKVVAAETHLHS